VIDAMKFIIYTRCSGFGQDEVIITSKKYEKNMLRDCFLNHGGDGDRELEDYDRVESNETSVCLTSRLFQEW